MYLLVVIAIVSAGICYSVAKKRGLNVPFWVAMGALVGPIALPFLFMAKSKKQEGGGES